MVLCAQRGDKTCTLYDEKSPVCIQTLRTFAGIGGAETQSPGMLWKPGDLPQVCPRPKKFKRLATHDTLHGSRPNLRQREPDGRIVPIPPDVWDEGASTKRCARREKKSHNYTSTYTRNGLLACVHASYYRVSFVFTCASKTCFNSCSQTTVPGTVLLT